MFRQMDNKEILRVLVFLLGHGTLKQILYQKLRIVTAEFIEGRNIAINFMNFEIF